MSSMSYCRFENTQKDFSECCMVLKHIFQEREERLEGSELEAAKSIVQDIIDFVEFYKDEELFSFEEEKTGTDFMEMIQGEGND